ncbi:MAG TPA: hypothetical protein VEZ88_13335 [Steroidobacteraceae bacterium]|nr:hypothetical protein [Steroidobacteraceae bacterium]
MFTLPTLKPALLMGMSTLALFLALGSLDVKADPPAPDVTPSNSSSHTAQQRADDGHTKQTSGTHSDGKTATRNAVVTNDKDNAHRARDVTHSGVNDKTSTVKNVTTGADVGNTRNTTATGPNGSSETRVTSLACDKAIGNCTLDVTKGPDSAKH